MHLISNGLWLTLTADYMADTAELLINSAASLLTHTGTTETLSHATRSSYRDVYAARWWASPDDKVVVEEIPSAVLAPGSWTVRTTAIHSFCRFPLMTLKFRVNEPIAFRAGVRYKAGQGPKARSTISNYGTSLLPDAVEFSHLERFVVDDGFVDDLEIYQPKDLCSNILNLSALLLLVS